MEKRDIELWVPIIGYEGLYEISSWGNVKSLPKAYGKYVSKEKIMKLQWFPYKGNGYQVSLKKLGKAKSYWVHILVGLHFIANPENKPELNHKDFDRRNNYYGNLEWATRAENVKHSYANNPNRGTAAKKIYLKDANNSVLKTFPRVKDAAKEWGVSRRTILRWASEGKKLEKENILSYSEK